MENQEIKQPEENTFFSNTSIKNYLEETAKWGKFLAIVGYIGIGILVLLALLMMVGLSFMNKFPIPGFAKFVASIMYLVLAVIYYFPIHYLYNFSVNIKKSLMAKDFNTLTTGFQNLKSLFQFIGIFTIIVLSMYVLAFIVFIALSLFAFI